MQFILRRRIHNIERRPELKIKKVPTFNNFLMPANHVIPIKNRLHVN